MHVSFVLVSMLFEFSMLFKISMLFKFSMLLFFPESDTESNSDARGYTNLDTTGTGQGNN